MRKEYEGLKERAAGERPVLIILVGESGAGKSTLCKFIDCPDTWYSSSGTIVRKLNEQGVPVTHDSIHNFANRAYAENPEWQVPDILASMMGKKVLVLDGPRRIKEVQALKRENPSTVIFRITSDEKERFKRLQLRDGVDREEFARILRDESKETELGQLLAMAEVIIENNGSLEEIKERAKEIKELFNDLEKI